MRTMILRSLIAVLVLGTWSFQSWSPVHAEMTCPDHQPVTIDVRPGTRLNTISLKSTSLIPVAVLTNASFDASQFNPEMAHLSDASAADAMMCDGATAVSYVRVDVNRDGRPDLLFFFKTQDTNLTLTSTSAMLMAHGSYNGTTLHIMGTDSVKIVP